MMLENCLVPVNKVSYLDLVTHSRLKTGGNATRQICLVAAADDSEWDLHVLPVWLVYTRFTQWDFNDFYCFIEAYYDRGAAREMLI